MSERGSQGTPGSQGLEVACIAASVLMVSRLERRCRAVPRGREGAATVCELLTRLLPYIITDFQMRNMLPREVKLLAGGHIICGELRVKVTSVRPRI